jgi:SAM-dependent methyltransferase
VIRPACNICGSATFGDTYGRSGSAFIRKNVRCEGCGSLERHRLIFEFLKTRGLLSGNRRILHIAPEECLATIFRNRFGRNYLCGDVDPAQFSFPGVVRMDLCRDLAELEPASFDIVLHNHVLEHMACDYQNVAATLHRLVRPGGLHVFSIPFMEGGFREALDDRTDEYRTAHFGQWDHMRIFSPGDLQETLGAALPLTDDYDATRLVPAERLLAINVPETTWRGFNNNAVFVLEKAEADRVAEPEPQAPAVDLVVPALAQRREAILFLSANGIGQGHLTRQLAVAKRLKHRPAVFATMSYSAAIAREMGFPVHFIPHHNLTGEEPGDWNGRLAAEIDLLVEAYNATTLVYDVNFVFDGLIEALKNRAYMHAVWIRRGMWPSHHASYAGAGVHFQTIIEPDDYAGELDDGPTVQDRSRTTMVPPILLLDPAERMDRNAARTALGLPQDAVVVLLDVSRASNPGLVRVRDRLLDTLLSRPGLHVVELASALSKNTAPRDATRHHQLSLYPAYAYSRAWDAAIVRASYNVFHENIAAGIPTLFVPDETPDMDRQIDRARWAEMHGAALMHRLFDADGELPARIERLLSAESAARLSAACAALAADRTQWQNGGSVVAALLEQVSRSELDNR